MANRPLTRDQLAKFLPNPESIRRFEKALQDVGEVLPTDIETAASNAATAYAIATSAVAVLAKIADALSVLATAPAPAPLVPDDDMMPRQFIGTLGRQNADRVKITGAAVDGGIDGTPIGDHSRSSGKFTSVEASEQIASTVAPGTAPLVVASDTQVANLNVSMLQGRTWGAPANIGAATAAEGYFTVLASSNEFGCNGATPQSSYHLPATATDLPTAIARVNAIATALIANGIAT